MTVNTLLIIIGITLWILYCWWTINSLKKANWNVFSLNLSDTESTILFFNTAVIIVINLIAVIAIIKYIIENYGDTIIF